MPSLYCLKFYLYLYFHVLYICTTGKLHEIRSYDTSWINIILLKEKHFDRFVFCKTNIPIISSNVMCKSKCLVIRKIHTSDIIRKTQFLLND